MENRSSYLVFVAERRYKKNKSPKTIVYRKMDEEIQRQLRISRRDEWTTWEKFNAAIAIPRAEREKLIAEGHQLIPTQWIETDKNDHRRRAGGPDVPALYKSRLVVRGDLENDVGVRTDSPTCELEGLR